MAGGEGLGKGKEKGARMGFHLLRRSEGVLGRGRGLHGAGPLTLAQLLGFLGSLFFLGQALTAMLVYVWSRRSPHVRVNFFGLLTFQAPFLPWALMGFSLLLGNSILVDLLGIAVGHIYYFLEDVFPNQPGGKRLLLTPGFLKLLLDTREDPNYLPLPEEQPGPPVPPLQQ